MNEKGRHLILYDGVCGLCNRWNTFILNHDLQGLFNFAPLQGKLSRSLLHRMGQDPERLETFFVITDYRSSTPRLLAKSAAALFVTTHVSGISRLTVVFRVVPAALLNVGYDLIARYRYRLFGRYDMCPIPEAQHKERFVDL